jgi:hypothetical protein
LVENAAAGTLVGVYSRGVIRAFVIVLLGGCAGERNSSPDALPQAPDADTDAALPDRAVNDVIVGATRVLWSHGQFSCSLEFGCGSGPTVTGFSQTHLTVFPWVDGGVGTWQIAGTPDELFYLYGETHEDMYVRRRSGDGDTALSIPRPWLMGPAVDDLYVYWAEGRRYGPGFTIRRSSRSGDGSDAALVAETELGTERLTLAGGYVWWIELNQYWLMRVPKTGGTPERVLSGVTALTGNRDSVYVGRIGNGTAEVGRVDDDGSYNVIASRSSSNLRVSYIVADEDLIHWSEWDGDVYFAPIAGGSVGSVAAADKHGHVFAVMPDRYLVEFRRDGFRSVPR